MRLYPYSQDLRASVDLCPGAHGAISLQAAIRGVILGVCLGKGRQRNMDERQRIRPVGIADLQTLEADQASQSSKLFP
jgi:hypothetical protein